MFKKITISIILTLILFTAADLCFFYYEVFKEQDIYKSQAAYNSKENIQKFYIPKHFFKLVPPYDEYHYNIKNSGFMRPIQNQKSKEQPVIIFGCSYAAGYVFDNKETISYIMSKYSDRPIINRAVSGYGVQHMLYQLENDKDFVNSIKPPKYIFYILMDNVGHFERLYLTNFPTITNPVYYLSYKEKSDKLVERKPLFNLYYGSAIFRHIYNKIVSNWVETNFNNNNPKIFDFFILHFETINSLIKQYWGSNIEYQPPQLIILTFEKTKKEMWAPQLEKEGIKVIDIAELIGIKDLSRKELGFFEPEISAHPNGKLWQQVVPKLKEMYPDL